MPTLEEYPSFEREPLKATEILIDNYKKALEWIVTVWETNGGNH